MVACAAFVTSSNPKGAATSSNMMPMMDEGCNVWVRRDYCRIIIVCWDCVWATAASMILAFCWSWRIIMNKCPLYTKSLILVPVLELAKKLPFRLRPFLSLPLVLEWWVSLHILRCINTQWVVLPLTLLRALPSILNWWIAIANVLLLLVIMLENMPVVDGAH